MKRQEKVTKNGMTDTVLDKVVRKGLCDQAIIEYIPDESEETNHSIWRQNIEALQIATLMWENA